MKIKKIALLCQSALVFFISLSTAQAALSPLAVSIIPPVEFPPPSFDVVGARLSILWGEQRAVYGIDVGGLGNISDVSFAGLAVAGGFNYNKGSSTILGLQAAGLANINVNNAHIVGLQVAAGMNSNVAESSLIGLQVALANLSQYTTIGGLQVGIYNTARAVYGLQIGLVNVVDNLHGLQIGLANFNHQGLFAFAPILNVGF